MPGRVVVEITEDYLPKSSAGLTIRQSLEQLRNNPPDRSLRPRISEWLNYLDQGLTVAQSVQNMGQWMPSFDLALIEAGEQSGRLDACFKLLALYYSERARMVKQAISDLLYPLFILHMAAFIFPFIDWFKTGNTVQFLFTVLLILGPLYAGVFLLVFACQGRHGERWRSIR